MPQPEPQSEPQSEPLRPTDPPDTPDLSSSITHTYRQIRRELPDPAVEGRERIPWFLWVTVATLLCWSGWYIGRRGGSFDAQTHLEYATGAASGPSTAAAPVDPIAAGKQIYTANCAACHQSTGLGIAGAFPPLLGASWVTGPEQTLVRILLHGLGGPLVVTGVTYDGAMPAWQESLSDADIAHVATYIRQWAPNAAPPVLATTVAALRTTHTGRPGPWTAAELTALEAVPTTK